MLFLAGLGGNIKRIGNAGFQKCPNCNNWQPWGIYELSKQVTAFFIPVAKWDRKHYIICPICKAALGVGDKELGGILQKNIIVPDDKKCAEIWNAIDTAVASEIPEITKLPEEEKLVRIFTIAQREVSSTYSKEQLEIVLAPYIRHMAEVFGVKISK